MLITVGPASNDVPESAIAEQPFSQYPVTKENHVSITNMDECNTNTRYVTNTRTSRFAGNENLTHIKLLPK